jgi:hypothetical protein
VVNELAEFDRAWDDEKQRLTVNLTILSIIREVRVQPRNPGDEILNRYELAKRGWSCNYERVDLLLADGTVIDLDVEWSKILTPKAA